MQKTFVSKVLKSQVQSPVPSLTRAVQCSCGGGSRNIKSDSSVIVHGSQTKKQD